MNVLIFGLGLNQGGVGSAKYFASQGAEVRVTDLKKAEILKPSLDQLKAFPDIEYSLGEHKYQDIDWADLIIKNPAVKPGNPYLEYAQKKGKRVEQDMGIFLDFVKPTQIIGVTGTKGKSTTASLIYEVLKKSLLGSVILAGNIGTSVLDVIPHIKPDTLVVLEISSFQLEAFDQHQVSPKWAVITNITPDHLNYYQTMDEYINSKRVIGKYQTADNFLFLRIDDPIITKPAFLKGFKAQINYFSSADLPKNFKPHIMGKHNLENIAAALKIAKIFNVPQTQTLNVASTFSGVPFRMELIKKWHGVKIINDTTATGPDAGIKALQTFPNCILICGGMNKNMPYDKYVKAVNKYAKKVFFLEGDSTDAILSSLRTKQNNLPIFGPYNNLDELLTDVKSEVQPGDIILFSPAATSFNLFQNEFDRGRKFNQAVEKVFYMKVLTITGGASSERRISLMSAKQVKKSLEEVGHKVKLFDLKKGFKELKKIYNGFDVIFPVIHGEEGEGGTLQQFLSKLGKPFVGGDPKGYKKGWYKIPFKKFCDENKILTSPWREVKSIKDIKNFGFPSVLKSSSGGSSREVVILKSKADLKNHLANKLFKLNLPLFVEKYLPGIEVTVAVLENKALPVIEIIPPKDGWFDYQNKYWGATQEIPHAPSLDEKTKRLVQKIAEKIHKHFNLGQFSRIDFIISNGKPYVLEINTIPGLTASSLLPKAAQAAGISFPKLLDKIIKIALKNES